MPALAACRWAYSLPFRISRPRVQAGQRRAAAAGDPVSQRLSGAADRGQRPVGFQENCAGDGK